MILNLGHLVLPPFKYQMGPSNLGEYSIASSLLQQHMFLSDWRVLDIKLPTVSYFPSVSLLPCHHLRRQVTNFPCSNRNDTAKREGTPRKINMEPENTPLEKDNYLPKPSFSGSMLIFGEVNQATK